MSEYDYIIYNICSPFLNVIQPIYSLIIYIPTFCLYNCFQPIFMFSEQLLHPLNINIHPRFFLDIFVVPDCRLHHPFSTLVKQTRAFRSGLETKSNWKTFSFFLLAIFFFFVFLQKTPTFS